MLISLKSRGRLQYTTAAVQVHYTSVMVDMLACCVCVCVCSVTSYINSAIHHSVITVLIYRLFTLFTMSSLAVTLTLLDGRYDDADDVM